MTYKILTLQEKSVWKNLLGKLPKNQQDVYYTPEYYSLYENYGDGKAQCFVFEKNGELALYPFLINSINKLGYELEGEYYDIQGAYGYNGVVSSSYDKEFIERFYDAFEQWCQNNNIIAEFIRFHPILENFNFSVDYVDIIPEMDNVILDLAEDDFFYNSYEHSTRKNIKKAEKKNLKTVHFIGEEADKNLIQEFYDIYLNTMKRNKAITYYYFNLNFFYNLFENLGENVMLSFTSYNDNYISTEIVPFGNYIAYSFLGGTHNDFFQLRPGDLLKHSIILKLKNKKIRYFCLGGGPQGVIKFKKSFAKKGLKQFYIGKKIYNQKIYHQVVSQWEEKYPESFKKHNNMLLGYREI